MSIDSNIAPNITSGVKKPYIGRFAPSPTGYLHIGSLISAVASWLQAKHCSGQWLLRIEDLDPPREVAGAAEHIIETLATFGLVSDQPVIYQSQRQHLYQDALQQLIDQQLAYPCACTRKMVKANAKHFGIEGAIYPDTCRDKSPSNMTHNLADTINNRLSNQRGNQLNGQEATNRNYAWRVRTSNHAIEFDDFLFKQCSQNIHAEIGDFPIKRADGYFAYQLAVVVDDHEQGITEVVRGADLLTSTARQILLQEYSNYPTPQYFHHAIAINNQGEKLSKQTFAEPIHQVETHIALHRALSFLNQQPPAIENTAELLHWAQENWNRDLLKPTPMPAPLPTTTRESH